MISDILIKTAKLARLNITENQDKIIKELESILEYVDVVNKVEGKVEKDLNMSENQNVFKDDIVEKSLSVSDVLKNAPKSTDNFIEIEGIF